MDINFETSLSDKLITKFQELKTRTETLWKLLLSGCALIWFSARIVTSTKYAFLGSHNVILWGHVVRWWLRRTSKIIFISINDHAVACYRCTAFYVPKISLNTWHRCRTATRQLFVILAKLYKLWHATTFSVNELLCFFTSRSCIEQ